MRELRKACSDIPPRPQTLKPFMTATPSLAPSRVLEQNVGTQLRKQAPAQVIS